MTKDNLGMKGFIWFTLPDNSQSPSESEQEFKSGTQSGKTVEEAAHWLSPASVSQLSYRTLDYMLKGVTPPTVSWTPSTMSSQGPHKTG